MEEELSKGGVHVSVCVYEPGHAQANKHQEKSLSSHEIIGNLQM